MLIEFLIVGVITIFGIILHIKTGEQLRKQKLEK